MTVIESELITVSPLVYCAKSVVLPAVAPACTHSGSSAPWGVMTFGVPVCHVTLAVTSIPVCPPAVARTVRHWPLPDPAVELAAILNELLGLRTILVTLANVTVAVVVAVAVPDAAVMVLVPAETPVNVPPVLMVATLGVSLDQHTVVPVQLVPPVRVMGLPLLSVPAAFNCVESPTLTVGLGGRIEMVETVGFTKNPVQLTASANTASAAKAPARRSFCFADDIVI